MLIEMYIALVIGLVFGIFLPGVEECPINEK